MLNISLLDKHDTQIEILFDHICSLLFPACLSMHAIFLFISSFLVGVTKKTIAH